MTDTVPGGKYWIVDRKRFEDALGNVIGSAENKVAVASAEPEGAALPEAKVRKSAKRAKKAK